MRQYQDMLYHILKDGKERLDRTGTGTIGVFGYQNRYDLRDGFPLMTTKAMPPRVIWEELDWFLAGDTNVKTLIDKNVKIWNADAYRWHKRLNPDSTMSFERFLEVLTDADEDYFGLGDLGPIYGKQWRSWDVPVWSPFKAFEPKEKSVDQIKNVIESIKNDPYGRRHIVSAWNVADLDKMALPPCHLLFQFYVSNDNELSCELYQRSADAFLGVPFNIASYAFLVHVIAHLTGLKVGEFVHTFGDLHIYKNHIEQVKEQIFREPRPLPKLIIKSRSEITKLEDFNWDSFELIDYNPHPPIKGQVSVGN